MTTQQPVESAPLSWATLGVEGQFTDLLPNIPQYLNVCEINDENKLSVRCNPWPIEALDIFKETGGYLFHVLIDANDDMPSSIKLRLHWTGDWKTAEMFVC